MKLKQDEDDDLKKQFVCDRSNPNLFPVLAKYHLEIKKHILGFFVHLNAHVL